MAELAALLDFVQADHRVCLRPMDWQDFFVLIGGIGPDHVWRTHPPLVLAQWRSTNGAKRLSFIEHVKWAAENGRLDEADRFLRALTEDAWHHEPPGSPVY